MHAKFFWLLLVLGISLPLDAKKYHKSFRDLCCHANKFIKSSRFRKDERIAAFKRRLGTACLRTLRQKKHNIACENNGDERRVPYFAAMHTKALEHDPVSGLLTPAGQDNYRQLLKALKTGSQDDFNAIERAPGATMKFISPQSGFTFCLDGCDSSTFDLELFPILSSPEAAAQLIELYLMQLCRDVFFSDYGTGMGTDATNVGTGSLTNNAALILTDLGPAYTGPRNLHNEVDWTVLFRGSTYGALIGPYVSQFLLLDVRTDLSPGIGCQNLNQDLFIELQQLIPVASPQSEFAITMNDFVTMQNGKVPRPYVANDYLSAKRYRCTGRDVASFVHFCTPIEEPFFTLKILFASGFPLSAASPYVNGTITNESAFVTLGIFDAFGLLGGAADAVSKACWAQKWRAQRVLRPEAFGGLIQYTKTLGSNPFNLNQSFFVPHSGLDLLSLVQAYNANNGSPTYLLSQVYPEGCPTHPSYPQGHSTGAGAAITVIKAIFNDTVLISSYVTPQKVDPNDPTSLIDLPADEGANEMTLASELDKLAYNIAFGRNYAGIHYRADADNGVAFGEEVGIRYLQDRAAMITEETFTGFEITKLDGTRVRITGTCVEPI